MPAARCKACCALIAVASLLAKTSADANDPYPIRSGARAMAAAAALLSNALGGTRLIFPGMPLVALSLCRHESSLVAQWLLRGRFDHH